jgi:transglutaminase-like putative cysteine protease
LGFLFLYVWFFKKIALIKSSFFLPFLFFAFVCNAQDLSLSVLTIPKELKENANAVIRNEQIDINILAVDEMIVSQKRTITVLNKSGNSSAAMFEHYDNDTKITKLSAVIYDAFGKEIQKYPKGKFLDVSAVGGGTLYSDDRVKYLDYTPTSYPYTLVFESEYKTSSTGFIPGWVPIDRYFVAVENSKYNIINTPKISWRKKNINFTNFDIKVEELENNITYTLKNQPAFEPENVSIDFREFIPRTIFALESFSLKGTLGNNLNWKDFGLWMHEKLLKGRDELSPETIAIVKKMVEGVTDPIERAKLVYQYMQQKTRYISVQVGIGGWEPIAANLVDNVGYGDCKGLTNYTKALLDVADVTAYYTVVYADDRIDIDKDFSSLQGNHVILNIPNNGKDIWLECTSQTMPFGFLGDFTDDRDVLVVTPEGGFIKHTASYKNEQNLQTTKATIQLFENGNLTAGIKKVSTGIQYDSSTSLERFTQAELINSYKTDVWNYINNLEISKAIIENDKNKIEFKEDLEVSIENFATVNESEYIFRVNVFSRNNFVPNKYSSRKLPLKIERGYKDIDEFTFKIPSNYKMENLPAATELNTKFGVYKIAFKKINENSFIYSRELFIKEGVYPKEDYEEYRNFRRTIAKLENLRIAIIKQ